MDDDRRIPDDYEEYTLGDDDKTVLMRYIRVWSDLAEKYVESLPSHEIETVGVRLVLDRAIRATCTSYAG